MSRATLIRVPSGAALFTLLLCFFALVHGTTLLICFFSLVQGSGDVGVPAPDEAVHAVAPAAPASGSGGLWPPILQNRHKPIKLSGCCWLLACCLLSGDIEVNPGPADRLRTLRMFCQDVCSVKNKLGTLRSHAGELAGYDVVGLTETWLGPLVSDSELQLGLSDQVWFRKDRDGRGGGVACAVKSSLSPVHRPDLEPDCEVLAVQIETVRPVIVAVCYRPPDVDGDVDKIAGFIHTSGKPTIPSPVRGLIYPSPVRGGGGQKDPPRRSAPG